jgi:DNA-binding XRE family transcriptional regulator
MSDLKNKKGVNNMTKLKGYRVMLGKTQRDMAKELNISVQSYNNKETGKTAFNDREKLAIKTMISEIKSDITIDELFY